MTKEIIENMVAFVSGILFACVYLVDRSGFDIKETAEREVVTVYCLGNKSAPVYCKTVKEEYEDLTDNEYKGKFYE